jgi:hypothetical protein
MSKKSEKNERTLEVLTERLRGLKDDLKLKDYGMVVLALMGLAYMVDKGKGPFSKIKEGYIPYEIKKKEGARPLYRGFYDENTKAYVARNPFQRTNPTSRGSIYGFNYQRRRKRRKSTKRKSRKSSKRGRK